jgi:hypothetical protein
MTRRPPRYPCRDRDCEHPLCSAFREGYEGGYRDGYAAGATDGGK